MCSSCSTRRRKDSFTLESVSERRVDLREGQHASYDLFSSCHSLLMTIKRGGLNVFIGLRAISGYAEKGTSVSQIDRCLLQSRLPRM